MATNTENKLNNCEAHGSIANNNADIPMTELVMNEEEAKDKSKNWHILAIIGFANILLNAVGTMQAPFYPREAEQKGASATEYGLVFSVFQLATFFSCPFVGRLACFIRPKSMYLFGLSVTAICTILFGLLEWENDRITFIALSLLLRSIEGAATSAFFTAAFTIVAATFPTSVAVTFGMIQTCAGVGLIIGPSLGGLLFELGGFSLPFISVGGLLLLSAILAHFILPQYNENKNSNKIEQEENREATNSKSPPLGFISLIKIPAVTLDALCILVCSSGIGFLEATLEPHVRKNFGFSAFSTGLIFIIAGAGYAATSPFWGRLCDAGVKPKFVTLAGFGLTFTSFLFVGPPPGIFETTLWAVCLSQAIHGVGAGATLVSARMQASQNAFINGYPNNLTTYGLVSSVWVASYSLGNFIGPTIGGILLDLVGFRVATTFVLATQAIIIGLLMLCMGKR